MGSPRVSKPKKPKPKPEKIRRGQDDFNFVYKHWPEVAQAIEGTEDDPFYDDERIWAFWNKVNELLPVG